MLTVKVGTKTTSAKEASIRCTEDYYSVVIILADDTTDIKTLRNEFDEAFDGTVTLPGDSVISNLVINDLTRNYSEDGVRTNLHLEAVSNETV